MTQILIRFFIASAGMCVIALFCLLPMFEVIAENRGSQLVYSRLVWVYIFLGGPFMWAAAIWKRKQLLQRQREGRDIRALLVTKAVKQGAISPTSNPVGRPPASFSVSPPKD